MVVMAATNTPNASAPSASAVLKPSTTARLTQSLADPSVSPAASTMRPISSVRGSIQAASAPRAPFSGASSWATAASSAGGQEPAHGEPDQDHRDDHRDGDVHDDGHVQQRP